MQQSVDAIRTTGDAHARWFGRMRPSTVGRKLILIYIFGIFVPLVVANGLVFRSVLRDAQQQQKAYLLSVASNIEASIAREFEPIELVSEFVYADKSIYRLLGVHFSRFEDYIEAHQTYLVPALTKYANVFAGISRITIYTDNPILRVSAGYLRLDTFSRESLWYRRLHDSGVTSITMAHLDTDPRTEIEPHPYVSLFRELSDSTITTTGELVLRIDVNPAVIQRHLHLSGLAGRVEIVDPWGTVAAQSDAPSEVADGFDFDLPFPSGSSLYGWSIRGIIAPAGAPEPWSARWTMLLVVSGLSVAFSSLFIMLLSRSVTNRLARLSSQMHRVDAEDFSPVRIERPGRDEIGQLIGEYNRMATRIESLINDQYKSEIERHQLVVARQQAELDAMQSQVNPHFLFNVLESIRMKSHVRGEHETARVVKQLSRSIRRLTSWKQDLISIEEEIEFAREYVEIQQYRFGDRLSARISIDARANAFLVPKLTIQGLVENACVHGLEPKTGGGTASVTVALEDGELRIRVQDDGVGCVAERVRRIIDQRDTGARHIGIANIHRRLQLHFGDRCAFSFDSEPDEGTTVEITIRGTDGAYNARHS